MPEIEVSHLTKDYGSGRGVFDVSLEVERGECFGFLGPNGAGKTTTIRHLMGFSRPQAGTVAIHGQDCWTRSAELQRTVGYLPGEIALPAGMTGTAFLRMMERMRGVRDDEHLKMLLDTFRLDPDILILDEPTSGLDPVMQQVFIDYVLWEKGRGKTVFLSSHLFNEVDATCDRIAIIKDGRIVSQFESNEFHQRGDRFYQVSFATVDAYQAFAALPYEFAARSPERRRAKVHVNDAQVNRLIADLADADVADFEEIPFTLEDYFMQFYREDRQFGEVR